MTVPPDFGGHEFEEGLLEDLGGPHEKHPAPHDDEPGSDWDDNELHAAGQTWQAGPRRVPADRLPRKERIHLGSLTRHQPAALAPTL
jgi:hypothetical protein